MIVTALTKRALAERRFLRRAAADGYIEISENGDPLWKFHRGAWIDSKITEAIVGPDGHSVFIRVQH